MAANGHITMAKPGGTKPMRKPFLSPTAAAGLE